MAKTLQNKDDMKIQNNYHKPNSKTARKLLIGIKSFIASLAGLTIVQKEYMLLYGLLIGGFLLTEIINFISSDEEDKKEEITLEN
jgi:hypothetical protein